MQNLILTSDYPRIKFVHSFHELVSTPLSEGINALCWQRQLEGDFEEVVQQLMKIEVLQLDSLEQLKEQLTHLNMQLSQAGQRAAATLAEDFRLLSEFGLEPMLDCIQAYARDDASEIIPTDVYSFHVDSAPFAADTYLCAYTEAASEGLRNDQAQRKVDIPELRAALLREYGKPDDQDFNAYLTENCYDLHYAAQDQAQPFCFGLGNLWRIATEYPDSPVPPCIHRAPETQAGRPPRLLLIS